MLVRKLTKIGKSFGIILPREVLRLAEIDESTELALGVERGKIVLSRFEAETFDPFALLRRHIPRKLSDKQVGEIIDRAVRRIRHAASAKRRHR